MGKLIFKWALEALMLDKFSPQLRGVLLSDLYTQTIQSDTLALHWEISKEIVGEFLD